VVAEEVRNLAAKSMDAARQTSQLLEDTVNRVNQGMSIAGRTSESLKHIVEAVSEVTDINARVSEASGEESDYYALISDGFARIMAEAKASASMTQANESDAKALSDHSDALRNLFPAYKPGRERAPERKAARETAPPVGDARIQRVDFTAARAKTTLSPESKKAAKAALTQVIKLDAVQERRRKAKVPPAAADFREADILSSADFGKY